MVRRSRSTCQLARISYPTRHQCLLQHWISLEDRRAERCFNLGEAGLHWLGRNQLTFRSISVRLQQRLQCYLFTSLCEYRLLNAPKGRRFQRRFMPRWPP
jgi:hypothetical protein